MSDKQTNMEFKSYYITKTPEERIAYVKANPDKYSSLDEYRKKQSPLERKVDVVIKNQDKLYEIVQRFMEYQDK